MAEVSADVTAIVNGGEAPDQQAAAERMAALCTEAQEIRAATGERLPAAVGMILGAFGIYEANRLGKSTNGGNL